MTQCNPCPIMKPLIRCMEILTVGTVADAMEDYYVYIKNHTTNTINRFEALVDIAGLLTVDLTAYPQIEGHNYELWVTLQDGGIDDRETITINSVEYTCFAISFVDVLDDEKVLVTGLDQVLEAA